MVAPSTLELSSKGLNVSGAQHSIAGEHPCQGAEVVGLPGGDAAVQSGVLDGGIKEESATNPV